MLIVNQTGSRLAEVIRNTQPWCAALLKAPYVEVDIGGEYVFEQIRLVPVVKTWQPGFVVDFPVCKVRNFYLGDNYISCHGIVVTLRSVDQSKMESYLCDCTNPSFRDNGTRDGGIEVSFFFKTSIGNLQTGYAMYQERALVNEYLEMFIKKDAVDLLYGMGMDRGDASCFLSDQNRAALAALSHTYELMECKNVTAREVASSRKRSKRKRQVDSYYILDIPGHREYWKSPPKGESQDIHRLHICRGHFKTYTEDSPRFGRPGQHGKFWIPSHVRGNKELGIITKDYTLTSGGIPK